MTNLIERLREWQYYDPKAFGREMLKDIAEAADKIERLTAALEDAVDSLEAMNLHIDNSLYDRLREQLGSGCKA